MKKLLLLPLVFPLLIVFMAASLFTNAQAYEATHCSEYQSIRLCAEESRRKGYTDAAAVKWQEGSAQYDFFNCDEEHPDGQEGDNAYGELFVDEWGFYQVEKDDQNYYVVSMPSYYTEAVGDRFRITITNGTSEKLLYVIVGDLIDNADAKEGVSAGSYCMADSGEMFRFLIDEEQAEARYGAALPEDLNRIFDADHDFKGTLTKIERETMGMCSAGNTGGILNESGVQIDFSKKYYRYNANGIDGSPNVCDANNITGWPFSHCYPPTSYTGGFNRMICSSYASSRMWEVRNPNGAYPLPADWDRQLSVEKKHPCWEDGTRVKGDYSTDANNPLSQAIASISYNDGQTMHVVFIEGVSSDGSVVISEANATKDNAYGWRCRKFESFQAFLDSYGARLLGMFRVDKDGR